MVSQEQMQADLSRQAWRLEWQFTDKKSQLADSDTTKTQPPMLSRRKGIVTVTNSKRGKNRRRCTW